MNRQEFRDICKSLGISKEELRKGIKAIIELDQFMVINYIEHEESNVTVKRDLSNKTITIEDKYSSYNYPIADLEYFFNVKLGKLVSIK